VATAGLVATCGLPIQHLNQYVFRLDVRVQEARLVQSLQALQHAMGDGFNQSRLRWPPFLEKMTQRRAMVLTHEAPPLNRSPDVEGIDQLHKAGTSHEPLGENSFLISGPNFKQ